MTFDVPGDGKFKVVNTVENSTSSRRRFLRRRVSASRATLAQKFLSIRARPATPSGDFLDDGEYLNAYEFAKAQGAADVWLWRNNDGGIRNPHLSHTPTCHQQMALLTA